jgi:hypothetical protein
MSSISFSGTSPGDETERMRRHLRALSAVNQQLHAQLESGTLSIRRPTVGGQWIEQLQLLGTVSEPFLVRHAQQGNFLVEQPLRRPIKAGMIYVALEGVLGAGREVGDAELDAWTEGPPVEVLEANFGPAFIIVGGRRLTIRGLPLPFSVTAEEMMRFPEGQELRVGVAAGGSSKTASTIARARKVARQGGVASVFSRGMKKIARKLRNSRPGS